MKVKCLLVIIAVFVIIGCGASEGPDTESKSAIKSMPEPVAQEPKEKAVVFVIHPWNLKTDIKPATGWFFPDVCMPEAIRIMKEDISSKLKEYRALGIDIYLTLPERDHVIFAKFPKLGVSSCVETEPSDNIVFDDEAPEILEKLKADGVIHIYYMGFATDMCVQTSAFGIEYTWQDFDIRVIESCTLGVETKDTLKDKTNTKKAIQFIKDTYYK